MDFSEGKADRVQRLCGLTQDEVRVLSGELQPSPEVAEHLIENVLGYFPIPLGVATNFKIDGRDLLIPMAVKGTIAAASAVAKWVSREGEIRTALSGRLIIGQIQIPQIRSTARVEEIQSKLESSKSEILEVANRFVPGLVDRGGGIKNIEVRSLDRSDGDGSMMVVHLLCDAKDAMGANLINQVVKA